ncbi:MAG: fibro-slime domain-containing protein [Myxococcota bacterium]
MNGQEAQAARRRARRTTGSPAKPTMVALGAVFVIACSSESGTQLAVVGVGGAGADATGSAAGGRAAGGEGTGTANGGAGQGTSTLFPAGSGGGNEGGSSADCARELTGVVRDFKIEHPDFQFVIGVDPGIVESQLGADGKPVYAGNPTTPTTNGAASFDQWYRTTAGVNLEFPLTISLTESAPGVFTFDDGAFFPIDGQGFGNEGNPHNYHFTFEIRAEFVYQGGEVFTFTGDDDLFTFINGRLAIDLGGVHGPLSQTIDLDAQAAELGIEIGETYPLDFFFAERHTTMSNFRIDTSIACFDEVPIPR